MPTMRTSSSSDVTYVDTYGDDGKIEYRWAYYSSGNKILYDYRPYAMGLGQSTMRVTEYDAQDRAIRDKFYHGVLGREATPDTPSMWIDTNKPYVVLTVAFDFDGTKRWERTETLYQSWYGFTGQDITHYEKIFYDNETRKTTRWTVVDDNDLRTDKKSIEIRNADGEVTSLRKFTYGTDLSNHREYGKLIGSSYTTWDRDDELPTSSTTASFDKDGGRVSLLYNYDDGSRILYQWDPGELHAYSRIITRFDENRDKTSTHYTNDDGSSVLYGYDTEDAFRWTQVATYWDASGNRIKAVYDNDDGTHVSYEWAGGQEKVTYFTADWQII